MTYQQIRASFDRTATLAEKAHRFVSIRLDLIAQRKTPTPMMQGPSWILHLVPLSGIAERKSVDLREVYAQSFESFIGKDWGGGNRTFNFDGLVVHPGGAPNDGYYAYHHLFRTGALEAAQFGGSKQQDDRKSPIVWSLDMSNFFYETAKKFIERAKAWGFGGPALLGIAVLNVQGFALGIEGFRHPFSQATADRPNLIPPEAWIENLDSVNIDDALRPSLDVLWQAFGRERCIDFDGTTGAYSPRRE